MKTLPAGCLALLAAASLMGGCSKATPKKTTTASPKAEPSKSVLSTNIEVADSNTDTTSAPPSPQASDAGSESGVNAVVDNSSTTADDSERLTQALRLYYGDPSRPAVKSFAPLVQARLLSKIPQAPSGKKYVIDMARCEVRLENL